MTRTFFYSFLLLCSIKASGQVSEAQLVKYYSLLNRAELNICRGHADAALDLYTKAYEMKALKMSSKHLYHYFIVAAELKEWDKCELILKELKKRGWTYESYKKDIAKLDKATARELDKMYNRVVAEVHIDSSYIALLDSISSIDQQTNKHYRGMNFGLLSEEGKDTMRRLTKNNIHFLSQLFRRQFPTDELIGTDGHPWGRKRYDIILRHNAQLFVSHELDEVLYDAVGKGELAPEDFDYWVCSFTMTSYIDTILKFKNRKIILPLQPFDFVVSNDSLFQFPVDPLKIERSNNYRNMFLGFCTAGEFKEKLVCQFYHPQYHFVDSDYLPEVGMGFPEKIKKRLIYVGKKE